MASSRSACSRARVLVARAVSLTIAGALCVVDCASAAYSVGRVVPLTRERETDAKPVFSPDGTKIAFVSGRQGSKDIWMMNADGSDPYRLTSSLSPFQFFDDPAWSPDGSKIVCTSNRGVKGTPDLWLLDLQRATQTQLTDNDSLDWMPAWSRDGTKIAFVSDRSGQDSLWIMDANGSNPRLLVTGAWDPSWSPNGATLAYRSVQPGKEGVWTIPVEGGEPSLLLNGLEEPAWAPSGAKLAGVMRRDSRRELWLVSPNGGKSREISAAGANVSSPSWSPKGDAVVFDASLNENRDIYIMRLERQPPTAAISHPPADSRVEGIVDILGTVGAANGLVKSASVEFGAGETPTEWTTLRDRITNPIQDALLARWDTRGLAGIYTLRLIVTDQDDDTSFAMTRVKLLSDFGVDYVKHDTPTRMVGGQEYTAELTLENTGTMTWANTGSNAVYVSYRWIDDRGQVTLGLKTRIPVTVNLGEQVVVPARVKAPTVQGRYTLEWDLMQGELLWFSQRNATPVRVPVDVEVPYNAVILRANTPERMTPSQQYTIEVDIKNTGATAWKGTGDLPVGIGYHWYNADGTPLDDQPLVTGVPGVVAPGAEVKVSARLRAPGSNGKYLLRWDLRVGDTAWFSDMGATPLEASVSVINLYGVEFEEYAVSTSMAPGEIYVVNLKLKNAGSMKWYHLGANAIQISYRWLDEQGNPLTVGGGTATTPLTPLPYDVEPGQSAGVVVQVQSPAMPGTYTLQWDLVQGSSLWFSTQGSKPLGVVVIVARPSYAVAFSSKGQANTIIVGQIYNVSLNLKNTGTLTWATGGRNPVKLGYHWIDAAGNNVESLPILTDLPRTVNLGEEITVSAQMRAPDTAGTYTLKWDLFQEGQGWFSGKGGATLNIPVVVESLYVAKFLSHDTPKSQVSGQSYTIHLRIQNLGALRWESGGGLPVQLGYRWISGAGRTIVTKGLMTNLPFAVSKNDTVDIVAKLQAPETPGTYSLKWDMIQGDLVWFEEKGSSPLEVQVEVK